jgi:hypothetical protein
MTFGIDRLMSELKDLGHNPEIVKDSSGLNYALLKGFIIPAGRFEGRAIDLAIPAPNDYGQVVGSSIHIRSTPILMDTQNVAGVRNITASNLGPDWRYWSFAFKFSPSDTTQYLFAQILSVLKNA